MANKKLNKRGFTLVEMMLVVAIIVVIGSSTLFALNRYIVYSREQSEMVTSKALVYDQARMEVASILGNASWEAPEVKGDDKKDSPVSDPLGDPTASPADAPAGGGSDIADVGDIPDEDEGTDVDDGDSTDTDEGTDVDDGDSTDTDEGTDVDDGDSTDAGDGKDVNSGDSKGDDVSGGSSSGTKIVLKSGDNSWDKKVTATLQDGSASKDTSENINQYYSSSNNKFTAPSGSKIYSATVKISGNASNVQFQNLGNYEVKNLGNGYYEISYNKNDVYNLPVSSFECNFSFNGSDLGSAQIDEVVLFVEE